MIDGTPQVAPFTVDLHENLVKVPLPIRVTLRLLTSFSRNHRLQTLAQGGSAKTGPFHGSHRYPAHAVNPPHYEAKEGNEHKASPPS